ncbi:MULTISPECIES: N-acetylglucosamine kinase [unclassified Microbacterium]|uniref:N-acetylglucosamine kinase n=1 Tax=unclassified Microbacterium TaxID=2609290 RepID=UPI003019796D
MSGAVATAARALVGVDIGGTKTRIVRAYVGDESIVTDVEVASSSWRGALGDVEADASGLARLLRAHIAAGLDDAVVVGAHGCENTAQCLALEDALGRVVAGRIRVVNDSELIAPAMGARNAVGLVVGTGSIASARDGGGLVTAGGWGWILGDEGSAPALVREATRAVLASLDDGEPPDALGRALFAAFDVGDQDALALALTQAADPDDWGRHAPVVFAAADAGSRIAAQVVDRAGGDLARLVDRLIRRGVRPDAVVAGGSVIEGQPGLQLALRTALARTHPEIALHILDRPPVMGALALARELADVDHTPEERQST